MVFMPKTPVSISAQLRRDVTNDVYSGAALTSSDGISRRLFVAGFSIDELERIGITDSSQLSQLRSMDDVGSIDLITFQSDPEHLGFVLTEDLITVISNAKDDVGILTTVDWSIFEIADPDSETPFEGKLIPLTDSKGQVYRVPFDELPQYFEHVVTTGELMPNLSNRGDDKMAKEANNQISDDELRAFMENDASEDMDMTIEEKKSLDDVMFDDAEDYYNQQLKREDEEKRRQQEEADRRIEQERLANQRQAQAQQQRGGSQSDGVFIPNLKSFDEILRDLNDQPDSDIQEFYMSHVAPIAEFTDSMNIDASIFNSFDPQGRRDLMIAMNREREKLVSQAISQLKREAMDVEEQVEVDSEDSNVMIREKYMELYIHPLEEHQSEMRDSLADFEEERNHVLESGFADWWERVQNNPEEVYNEIYQSSIVDDAVDQEKERLSDEYSMFREERLRKFEAVKNEFVEKRRERDFTHLRVDWGEAARLGSQTLSDRVDNARAQMDSRKMMAEMRRMYDQMEKSSEQRIRNAEEISNIDPQIERPSQTSRQEGTVQQENPEPKVQAPSAPESTVEKPTVSEPTVPEPETDDEPATFDMDDSDFEDVFDDDENTEQVDESDEVTDDESFDEDIFDEEIEPSYDIPEPVINRPRDIYPVDHDNDEDEWDSFDENDLDDTYSGDHDMDDDFDDLDDFDDEYEDFDDESFDDGDLDEEDWDDELDDFEVEEKPRKKGLRGLFGRR